MKSEEMFPSILHLSAAIKLEENKSGDDEEKQHQQREEEVKDAAHYKLPNVSKEMVDSDFDSNSGESSI